MEQDKTPEADQPVTEYGIVQIVGGRHKGTVGFYDDENEWGNAIVYPGVPTYGDYFCVNKKFLRQPTEEQRQSYAEVFWAEFEQSGPKDEKSAREFMAYIGVEIPDRKPPVQKLPVRKAAWRRKPEAK